MQLFTLKSEQASQEASWPYKSTEGLLLVFERELGVSTIIHLQKKTLHNEDLLEFSLALPLSFGLLRASTACALALRTKLITTRFNL
jgi:hypothetical protein